MKAIGVLVIGLGFVMIVIGIMGTQSKVLADLKAVNPKLRQATGTGAKTKATANNSGGGGAIAV
jgi:hypothetical protein